MTKAYIYNPQTFEFIKEVEATVDPETTKRVGKVCYALSENSTLVAVPELKTGEIAIFNKPNRTWRVEKIDVKEGSKEAEELSETAQQIKCRANIDKYAMLMKEIEVKYNEYMSTPVDYNGAKYLPRYIEDYSKLMLRDFDTIDIWAYDGKTFKTLTKREFTKLYNYLCQVAEKAYKTKKENLQRCKLEIEKLEKKYNG